MSHVGILKIEFKPSELVTMIQDFRNNRRKSLDKLSTDLKSTFKEVINQLLYSEMTLFLGQSDQDNNKRNGYDVREYAFKGIGSVQIRIPVDRKR